MKKFILLLVLVKEKSTVKEVGFHIVNDPWTSTWPNMILILSVILSSGKGYCSKQYLLIPRLASSGSLIETIAGAVIIESIYYIV